ncbi:MAG: cytochrome c oxidase subunit 3 [Paracoccaceae bacterium]
MNPIAALAERPWRPDPRPAGAIHPGAASRLPTRRAGLWLFLAVVTVLFLLTALAYLTRMSLGDWVPVKEPDLLWVTSAVLVLTSLAMQRASWRAGRGDRRGMREALAAAGVLTLVFLAGQALACRMLWERGFYAAANPAFAFFYLLTLLHALHLAGGLAVLGATLARAGDPERGREAGQTVRLCAIYWHFLLVVWAVILGLMLADNRGAFDVIAMCRAFIGSIGP